MLTFTPVSVRMLRTVLLIAAMAFLAIGLMTGELNLTRIESSTL